jgi:glycosyltransferase involved in cell wall biosynthesis
MPNVLLLTRYDRLGAASRVRFLQFIPGLAGFGINVDVRTFFDDPYLEALYAGRSVGAARIAGFYLRRLRTLLQRRRYDLLWIEKEALPWLPAWLEFALLSGVPYVVELDDAWFHRYDRHPVALMRGLMGHKIDAVMRSATAVVVGNAYLQERAEKAGARHVERIPTVVDLSRYPPIDGKTGGAGRGLTVGWIGTPLNAFYLERMEPALRNLVQAGEARLRVVGAPVPEKFAGLPVESRPWSEATEIAEICAFDVGVMPLDDTPWERGKCAYKLLQVMAAGRPVIASPVGANCQVVRHGINGFLADSTEEWTTALKSFAADADLRVRMGAAARRTVDDGYSVERALPRVAAVLGQAAANSAAGEATDR